MWGSKKKLKPSNRHKTVKSQYCQQFWKNPKAWIREQNLDICIVIDSLVGKTPIFFGKGYTFQSFTNITSVLSSISFIIPEVSS